MKARPTTSAVTPAKIPLRRILRNTSRKRQANEAVVGGERKAAAVYLSCRTNEN